MMINKSGIHPQGHAVLVKPIAATLPGGKIVLAQSAAEKDAMLENRAIVVELGGEAWADEKRPRAKIGDHVLITRFAGNLIVGTLDEEHYRLVNARDIYCTYEDKP